MLRIGWESPEIPEFDPDIHNPEKVFAFLCYRGIHTMLNGSILIFSLKIGNLKIQERRNNSSLFLPYYKL